MHRSIRTFSAVLALTLAACSMASSPSALRQAQDDTLVMARHVAMPASIVMPSGTPGGSAVTLSLSKGDTSGPLLYVSDVGTFTVHVYTYPALKPAGKLTGFNEPQGLCADSAGNVWVTNTNVYQVREYAHGGTTPIATLHDDFGYPVGCAVDPSSGNLAVTNLQNFSGAAIVLLYKHARGTPAVYSNKDIAYYYFAGYDGSGNLYVSGQTSQHGFALGVLARGAKSISGVAVSGGTIYFPGTVAWNGSNLVLGDQRCKNSASSCLYRLTVSGKTAHVVGSTPLGGACDVAQAWVGASRVAAGEYQSCSHGPSGAALWRYPAGGKPAAQVTGLLQPVGAVVSSVGAP